MNTFVRLARVLLILALGVITVSFVIALARPETGPVEKVALLAMIAGCVALAGAVTTVATRMQERIRLRSDH